MNKRYLPYTLVGSTVTRPVQDPLAVLLLDNQLCINPIPSCLSRRAHRVALIVSNFYSKWTQIKF